MFVDCMENSVQLNVNLIAKFKNRKNMGDFKKISEKNKNKNLKKIRTQKNTSNFKLDIRRVTNLFLKEIYTRIHLETYCPDRPWQPH